VDLGFTAILSSIAGVQLPSELAEWNSTKTGHMLGSECDLKMHVPNLEYPLPLKIGSQKHYFRRFRNLTASLTAYVFGRKHDIRNRQVCWKLQWVSTLSQNVMNAGPQTA